VLLPAARRRRTGGGTRWKGGLPTLLRFLPCRPRRGWRLRLGARRPRADLQRRLDAALPRHRARLLRAAPRPRRSLRTRCLSCAGHGRPADARATTRHAEGDRAAVAVAARSHTFAARTTARAYLTLTARSARPSRPNVGRISGKSVQTGPPIVLSTPARCGTT